MDIVLGALGLRETGPREARMVTCPMKDKNYSGYCETCNERTSCMLQEIMERLGALEEAIRRVAALQPTPR